MNQCQFLIINLHVAHVVCLLVVVCCIFLAQQQPADREYQVQYQVVCVSQSGTRCVGSEKTGYQKIIHIQEHVAWDN